MAYSMDLRQRVVAAAQAGQTPSQVAKQFRVARATVRNWVDRHRRGELPADTTGPQGPIKLTADDLQRMAQAMADQPGITAKQLMPMLSVQVELPAVR